MSIKLRHKPARWDQQGRKLPTPYILDAWCPYCAMALVRDEYHPVEVCVVHVATSDYEKTLRTAANLAAQKTAADLMWTREGR